MAEILPSPQKSADSLPSLPKDLYGHLRDMHPESYEFKQDWEALNELATETGHAALALEHIFPPLDAVPPQGFSRETIEPDGAELPLHQFAGKINSLAVTGDSLKADVHHLVTDSGQHIRYCDLRPFMTSAVRKGGVADQTQSQALDRAVFRDLKFYAEKGHAKNHITDVPGVLYTKLGNTKIRSYWMTVKDTSDTDIPTLARLADCGDSVAAEADLYRRVFGMKL
jgi:hypothetical protein